MKYIILSLLAFCCTLAAENPPISKKQIENDLYLNLERKGSSVVQVGEAITVSIKIQNKSKTISYPLVLPGDGSEVGWREPHIFFTATITDSDGFTQAVKSTKYGRCGLFNPAWEKDIITINPNDSIEIKNWINSPSSMLEFQEAGHVQLYAHYSYRAGLNRKGVKDEGSNSKNPPTAMPVIPPFELVSSPVEFNVTRPLDLVLSIKSPIRANTKTKISDVLDIRLINRSNNPIEASSPTESGDARLLLEIEGRFGGWPPRFSEERNSTVLKQIIKPGEETSLLGINGLANGTDGFWTYPGADTIKVRATYFMSTWKSAPIIKSNWAQIISTESK